MFKLFEFSIGVTWYYLRRNNKQKQNKWRQVQPHSSPGYVANWKISQKCSIKKEWFLRAIGLIDLTQKIWPLNFQSTFRKIGLAIAVGTLRQWIVSKEYVIFRPLWDHLYNPTLLCAVKSDNRYIREISIEGDVEIRKRQRWRQG